MIRPAVFVVDDEAAIRRSMELMLRVLGHEVRAFESGAAFLEEQAQLARGCVLLDLRMPDLDGLEVQRRLNASGTDHSVVMMSGHGDIGVAVTAMDQGAIAFLEKPFPRAVLEQALDLAGSRIADPDAYQARLHEAAARLQALDPSDRQVLELVARGHDSESVARQTNLTAMAIEVARSRIHGALGAQTATEVLWLAFAARRATPN